MRHQTDIAGWRHYPASRRIKTTVIATLEPEPTNPHDPNAIKVLVDGRHVGYVPRQDTHLVTPTTVAVVQYAGRMDMEPILDLVLYDCGADTRKNVQALLDNRRAAVECRIGEKWASSDRERERAVEATLDCIDEEWRLLEIFEGKPIDRLD